MQQYHALTTASSKLVNEQTCATEENVRCALDEGKAIIDVACSNQELMLAYLNHLSRLQTQSDNLTDRIAREGDVPWSLRLSQENLHACEDAFSHAFHRLEADLHAWVLPEENVMLEVDRKLISQHNVYNWYQFTINGDRQICHF